MGLLTCCIPHWQVGSTWQSLMGQFSFFTCPTIHPPAKATTGRQHIAIRIFSGNPRGFLYLPTQVGSSVTRIYMNPVSNLQWHGELMTWVLVRASASWLPGGLNWLWDALWKTMSCILQTIDFLTLSCCVNSAPIKCRLFLWEECLCLAVECSGQDVSSWLSAMQFSKLKGIMQRASIRL